MVAVWGRRCWVGDPSWVIITRLKYGIIDDLVQQEEAKEAKRGETIGPRPTRGVEIRTHMEFTGVMT